MPVDRFASLAEPLSLDPIGEAVAAARRYVTAALVQLGRSEVEYSALLGVSELVTNCAIHARTKLTVAVTATATGAVRITVRDFSPTLPLQRHYGVDSTTGRGLRLVESISTGWGIEQVSDASGDGKVVWFEPTVAMAATPFDSVDWLAELES